ncbi:MAG: carbon-nitrogen hydrolase family protein [Lentisphaeraceae bacterium]|nr:carbon-nitrogen hydrolase family protein [Lentisphaeraceae bacterium]
MKILLLLLILLATACKPSQVEPDQKSSARKKVKVAAIQCFSAMGKIQENRESLTQLIHESVSKGAKIIVLPEAAVTGYMDPINDITWTTGKETETELSIHKAAEKVDGESIQYFSGLAKELAVYLTIPFIESAEGEFYNSVVLANPKGEIVAHHRKQDLWKHGDSGWCSEGELEAQVVDTEYGRLGMMICYDVHSMPAKLAAKKVDIVLYSVGWYGPNTEDWYKNRFPKKVVVPNKFSVIAANWSQEKGKEPWIGCGWSNVVYKNGVVLSISPKETGSEIVYADLFID